MTFAPETPSPFDMESGGAPRPAAAPKPGEQIITSPTLDKLVAALASAQGEFTEIIKNREADAGKYTYQYADLAAVLAAVRPALSKNKIALIQATVMRAGTIFLRTRVAHGAEFLEMEYPVCDFKQGVSHQSIGAALSYARRYSVQTILGVSADENDGEGSEAIETAAPAPAEPEKPKRKRGRPPKKKPREVVQTPPPAEGTPSAGKSPRELPPEVGSNNFVLHTIDGEANGAYDADRFFDLVADHIDDATGKPDGLERFDKFIKANRVEIDRLPERLATLLENEIERFKKAMSAPKNEEETLV